MLSDLVNAGSDCKVGARVRESSTALALSTKNSGSSTILLPPDPKVVLGGSGGDSAPPDTVAPLTATAGTPPVLPDARSALLMALLVVFRSWLHRDSYALSRQHASRDCI